MFRFACRLLVGALGFISLLFSASGAATEFTAEAVMVMPGTGPVMSRLYVGENGIRREFIANGNQMIEIVDTNTGHTYMLAPHLKQYMERDDGNPDPLGKGADASNPCEGMPNTTCKRLGKEDVNGRSSTKWEFFTSVNDNTVYALFWIDDQRNMPLRQLAPDGSVTELKMVGKENINNRPVERWEVLVTHPNGKTMHSVQWYDPELGIAIREEFPGGYIRELRNITIGVQAAERFEVPPEYIKVELPTIEEANNPRAQKESSGSAR